MLRLVHRLTALIVLIFLAVHISHHLSGIFGVEFYNDLQKKLRLVYRNPFVEPLIIGAVIVQLIIGVVLWVKSLMRQNPRGFWSWLQIISGALIFLTVSQHLTAHFLARVDQGLDTTFYWPLSVMDGPPFIYYFAPYYFLMVASVFAHAGAGLRYILMDRGREKLADLVGIGFIIFGLGAGVMIDLILAQVFFTAELPPEWVEYLRLYAPDYAR